MTAMQSERVLVSNFPGLTQINGKRFVVLYHGTCQMGCDSIRRTGKLNAPYLSGSEELAEYYAEEAAEASGADDWLVLALRLPVEDADKYLQADYNAHAEPISIGYPNEIRTEDQFHEALASGELVLNGERDYAN